MNTLTELEDRLAADDGDALRAQLMQQLQATATRLRGRLARPLPRDEFAAVSVCLQAAEAAQGVLGRWITGTARFSPVTGSGVARSQRSF